MNTLYASDKFKKEFTDYLSCVREENKQLRIETHGNAAILPFHNFSHSGSPKALHSGGVFDNNGNLIDLSKTRVAKDIVITGHPERYDINQNIKYHDEKVIYLGNFSPHFGHFLLEAMSRLWIYLDDNFSNIKAVYTGQNDVYFTEILEIFGLKKKNISRVKTLAGYKSVIIPEQSNLTYEPLWHKKYKETFDKIRDNSVGYSYDKIYLSRKKFQKRNSKVCGEYEIEEMFKNNGFKIIYPEQISIREQIGLMKNCKHLAGVQGTALHLSLFAQDNIDLTVIHRGQDDFNGDIFPLQIKINEMKKIKNTSVEAAVDFLKPFPFGAVHAISIRNKYMKEFMRDMQYQWVDTVENPATFEQYIGTEEYKQIKHTIKILKKIRERMIVLLTNFIFIKSLRKKIRYKFISS